MSASDLQGHASMARDFHISRSRGDDSRRDRSLADDVVRQCPTRRDRAVAAGRAARRWLPPSVETDGFSSEVEDVEVRGGEDGRRDDRQLCHAGRYR